MPDREREWIDCVSCGRKNIVDWDGKGHCITCTRDAVLGEHVNQVDESRDAFVEWFRSQIFELFGGLIHVADENDRIELSVEELNDREAEVINRFGEELWAWHVAIREHVGAAYGGCHNCYGKGYASVNDRWAGYGTDGDIGGIEGPVSGGNPNAMKFCTCERGQELKKRFLAAANEARLNELDVFADAVGPGKKGETWKEWSWRVADHLKARVKQLRKTNQEKL